LSIAILLLTIIASVCPDWVSRTEPYPLGTQVRYVPNGQYYEALYDVPGNITPTTFEWWLPIASCTDTTEIDTTETDTTNLPLYYNTQAIRTNSQVTSTQTSLIATAVYLMSVGFALYLLVTGFWMGRGR